MCLWAGLGLWASRANQPGQRMEHALTNMLCLTVQQPFASALVAGAKDVENRTWSPRGLQPGDWLAIHAGRTNYPDHGAWATVRGMWRGMPPKSQMPYGAVIGAVRFAEVLPMARCSSRWACGPMCWRFYAAVILPEVINARGALGLWTLPEEITTKVLEAIARFSP